MEKHSGFTMTKPVVKPIRFDGLIKHKNTILENVTHGTPNNSKHTLCFSNRN